MKLVVLFLLAFSAWGQLQTSFSCNASAGEPPLVRAEGVAELVGDIVVSCTGGTPIPAGQPLPLLRFEVSTTPTFSIGGPLSGPKEEVLLIGDPPPAQPRVEDCRKEWKSGDSLPDGCSGLYEGVRRIKFFAPVNPPGPGKTQTYRISGIRANTSELADFVARSFSAVDVNAEVRLTEDTDNPVYRFVQQLRVARIQKGSQTSSQALTARACDTLAPPTATTPPPAQRSSITFREGFNDAFQGRNAGPGTRLMAQLEGIPDGVDVWVRNVSGGSGFAGVVLDPAAGIRSQLAPDTDGWVRLQKAGGRAIFVAEVFRTSPNIDEYTFDVVYSGTPLTATTANGAPHTVYQKAMLFGGVDLAKVPAGLLRPIEAEEAYRPDFTNEVNNQTSLRDLTPLVIFGPCATGAQGIGLASVPGISFANLNNGTALIYDQQGHVPQPFNLQLLGTVNGISVAPAATNSPSAQSAWLIADALSTTTPTAVRVSFAPENLAPGTYRATLRISSTTPGVAAATVPLALTVRPPGPFFRPYRVHNVGSYVSNLVSPGEALVIFGERFGPPNVVAGAFSEGKLSTAAGETRVLFDGVAAPIIYAAKDQVSCLAPFNVAGKNTVLIEVEYRGVKSQPVRVPVVDSVPGLLTADSSGFGPAAAFNQDNSYNSVTGAGAGEYVVLFGVGGPGTDQPGRDGETYQAPLPKFTAPVTVFLNGKEAPAADVAYAGPAPGQVHGVWQVNVRLPQDAKPGSRIPVQIRFGSVVTQPGVTVAVRQ